MSAADKQYARMKEFRLITLCCWVLVTLGGCANLARQLRSFNTDVPASHQIGIETEAEQCQAQLDSEKPATESYLDKNSIKLFNWNIQKSQNSGSLDDLGQFSLDMDLVLIQEAALNEDLIAAVKHAKYWSFAPGYQTKEQITGVMTLSNAEPLVQCNLTNWEPWLRTPKATSITEYGLEASRKTLVVVNIHAINFTLGVKAFKKQLEQVQQILVEHEGPIIVSGDFNTWRKQRVVLLDAMAQSLDLKPLIFDADHRRTAFGHHLDHIYVRDLAATETATQVVDTSDHNPMSVNLSM